MRHGRDRVRRWNGPGAPWTRSPTRLATPHGVVLLQPAYTSYHLELGEISSYPPGYKENAEHLLPHEPVDHDRRDRASAAATEPSTTTCASTRRRAKQSSEVHRCEPYVYAQTIAGRDAPTHGEAKNSWLTGTAAWNLVAITQWILGIRPEHDGLRIDPCVPAAWAGFQIVRRFRGATYEISVHKRPGAVGRVTELVVDGSPSTETSSQWAPVAPP